MLFLKTFIWYALNCRQPNKEVPSLLPRPPLFQRVEEGRPLFGLRSPRFRHQEEGGLPPSPFNRFRCKEEGIPHVGVQDASAILFICLKYL